MSGTSSCGAVLKTADTEDLRQEDRREEGWKEEKQKRGNRVFPPVTSVLLLLFPAEALC